MAFPITESKSPPALVPKQKQPDPAPAATKAQNILLPNRDKNKSPSTVKEVPKKAVIPPADPQKESSFWDQLVMGVASVTAQVVLGFKSTKTRDLCILRAIVPEEQRILYLINNELPRIQSVLAKQLPFLMAFFSDYGDTADQVLEELILHTIGNIALTTIPQGLRDQALRGDILPDAYRMEPEELLYQSLISIAGVIGPDLSDADSAIKTADNNPAIEHFIPLAGNLFSFLFPEGDFVNSLLPNQLRSKIETKIAEECAKMYRPVCNWFAGRPNLEEPEESDIKEESDYYISHILESLSTFIINKEQTFFKKLTGEDHFSKLVEKSCEYIQGFIPESEYELKKPVQAVILFTLSHFFSEIFKEKIRDKRIVSLDSMMRKTTHFFSKKMRKTFKKNQSSPEEFQPDYCDLLGPFLPKLDWLQSFIERRQEILFEPITDVYFSLFNATVNDESKEHYKGRLRQVLWNRDGIRDSGLFGLDRIPVIPSIDDSVRAEIEPTVDALYHLCSSLITLVKDKGGAYASNEKYLIKHLELLLKDAVPEGVLKQVAKGIQSVLNGNDGEISWAGNQIHYVLEGLLFKGLVHILEKIPEGERHPPDKLLFKAFELILEIGGVNLPEVMDRINEHPNDEEFAIEAIAPIANAWIDLFLNGIPGLDQQILPKKIQDKAEVKIRKQVHTLLARMLITLTSWTRNRQNTETELKNLFPSKNPLRFCNLIPHFALEGIPYGLREYQETIVDDGLMPLLTPLLGEPSDQEFPIIHQMLHGFIGSLGISESEDLRQVFKFIGVFTETAVMRFITDLLGRIQQMEMEGISLTSPLEDQVLGNTKLIKEHLIGIGKTREDSEKSKISREDFINKFDELGLLHTALRGEDQKKEFLNQMTLKILKIFKIDETTAFPLPEYLWGITYDTLKKSGPILLDTICETICNVSTINQLLISALNKGAKPNPLSIIDRIFSDSDINDFKEHLKDLDSKFNDQFQLDLENELGKTVESLVGLQPDAFPKYLVHIESLRKFAAEAIGQPVRGELRNKKTGNPISILSIFDQAIGGVCDSLAPSDWIDDQLVYHKTTLEGKVKKDRETAEIKTADRPNLTRFFPKTENDKIRKENFEKIQRKKAEKNVPKFLKNIINEQTDQIFIELFIQLWTNFKIELHAWLIKNIGTEYGEEIFNSLLPVTRWVIKYPLAMLLLLFNYTIWEIASQLLKLIFNEQAQKRVKDLKKDHLHQNAAYKGLEFFLSCIEKELSRIAPIEESSEEEEGSVEEDQPSLAATNLRNMMDDDSDEEEIVFIPREA